MKKGEPDELNLMLSLHLSAGGQSVYYQDVGHCQNRVDYAAYVRNVPKTYQPPYYRVDYNDPYNVSNFYYFWLSPQY